MSIQPDTLTGALIVAVVFVVASARVTRLIVADTLPPIIKMRIWYEDHTSGGWETLMRCPWCTSFWVVALNGLAGWLAHSVGGALWTVWFAVNIAFAAAYVAGWLVFHDEDGN